MDSCRDIILHLLHNLGSRREIAQYLDAFTDEDRGTAIVKIGGGVLETQLGEIASALAFLWRVGLRPVVVHGAGPQLDRALAEESVRTERIGGQRVTTPVVLRIARRVFRAEAEHLADALERTGVRARPISSGVLGAAQAAPALGLVGDVVRVDAEPIRAALRRGELPIVSPLGETPSGQILNVNADVAAREVAAALEPRKVIFLTPTGGLLDDRGAIIPAVNLAEDFERLVAQPWVQGGMELKLREIRGLLERLPPQSSVSITSAEHLARELFTHRGDGTLVRRGETIREFDSLDGLDVDRLARLVEASFGRELRPGALGECDVDRVLLAGDYTAVAILTRDAPAPYLDKFAVTAEAQGVGLGASLWDRLVERAPRLLWRSRAGNPINPWYFQRASGMHRSSEWIVFWHGIEDRALVERCIDFAVDRPSSFTERPALAEASLHGA